MYFILHIICCLIYYILDVIYYAYIYYLLCTSNPIRIVVMYSIFCIIYHILYVSLYITYYVLYVIRCSALKPHMCRAHWRRAV